MIPSVPLGTILPFHPDVTDPALPIPDGWVACNGQVLDDPLSPLYGETMPSLNTDERFLRGGSVSGVDQQDALQGHKHDKPATALGFVCNKASGGQYTVPGSGSYLSSMTPTGGAVSDATYGSVRVDSETRPINMSVVWIIKVREIELELSSAKDVNALKLLTGGQSKIVSFNMPADTAGSLNGKYFTIDSEIGKHYIYMQRYSSLQAQPARGARLRIGIDEDKLRKDNKITVYMPDGSHLGFVSCGMYAESTDWETNDYISPRLSYRDQPLCGNDIPVGVMAVDGSYRRLAIVQMAEQLAGFLSRNQAARNQIAYYYITPQDFPAYLEIVFKPGYMGTSLDPVLDTSPDGGGFTYLWMYRGANAVTGEPFTSTDPEVAGRECVQVLYEQGDSASTIASKVCAALQQNFVSAEVDGTDTTKIRMESGCVNPILDVEDVDLGLSSLTVEQAGKKASVAGIVWDYDHEYSVNDIVMHLGKMYICIGENENKFPDVYDEYWEELNTRLADTGWVEVGATGNPAFLNSWGNLDTYKTQYRRIGSIVTVSVRATGGTNYAVFQLPEGFRPGCGKLYFFSIINGSAGYMEVDSDGTVKAFTTNANLWGDVSFFVD